MPKKLKKNPYIFLISFKLYFFFFGFFILKKKLLILNQYIFMVTKKPAIAPIINWSI